MSIQAKRAPLALLLKQGRLEGIEYGRGEATLTTTVVPVGRSFTSEEVAAVRIRQMS